MTGGRGIQDPRLAGVGDDPAERARAREADVLPGLAAIAGPVHAGAAERQRAAAGVGLTGPGEQRAVRGHRQRPDRLGEVVGPGCLVGGVAVRRLPHPAGRCRDEDLVGHLDVDGDVGHTAADVGGSDEVHVASATLGLSLAVARPTALASATAASQAPNPTVF